ncbi:MAG: hypothetical protein ACKVLN_03500 [Rhodobacterales bacterium]
MSESSELSFTKQFDLATYIQAFGDEETGFSKAFQSLLSRSDHESLDLGGWRVSITKPLDMWRLSGRTRFAQRRVGCNNGQLYATGDTVWLPSSGQSTGSYIPTDVKILSNVTGAAIIMVGSLVQVAGVGREVYV